jgi:flagellar biosynthetic protein FliQ
MDALSAHPFDPSTRVEMTLVFVPKILAIFVAMLRALPFMADALQGHMARIAARIIGG